MASADSPFSSRTSSLLKSAASTYNSLQSLRDAEAKAIWDTSGHTNDAYQQYSQYLQNRIGAENNTGTITGASKALTLSNELRSATRSNTSFNIQNETIQIMSGNATPTDKLNMIGQQYERAVGNGDMTLALSLEQQGYSLSQTIQSQQQTAATAAQTLSTANDTAVKAGYTSVINQIHTQVQDALSLIHSGAANGPQALKDLTATVNKALTDLGQPALSKDQTANIGSVVQAAFNAEFVYNQHASDALRATDPTAADAFAKYDANGNIVGGKAYDIMANQSYVSVPGLGNINAHDAAQIALNPELIGSKTNINGQTDFTRNQITGYHFANGTLVPLASQQDATNLVAAKKNNALNNSQTSQETRQLESMGFGGVKVNANGTITASFTDKTDKWINFGGKNGDLASNAMGRGNSVTLVPQANGSYQFAMGNRLLHVTPDVKGLGGLFETLPTGKTINIAGQYGFNQSVNNLISNATSQQLQFNAQQTAAKAAEAKLQATLAAAKVPTAPLYASPQPGALSGGAQPPSFAGNPYHAPGGPMMSQRAGGGFNFTNNGQAISAARYAQLTNTPFRTVLQNMATQGDSGARSALGFVGNDFGYDPTKVGGNGNLYNSLTWGTGRSFTGASGPNNQGGQLTLPSGFKL